MAGMALGGLKNSLRDAIGTHRRSAGVKALHRLASFVESAYANEGSSFHSNGEQDLLRKLKSANFQTAFDVGANFGDWSMEAAAVWPECRIHAFEVAPPTFERLGETVRASAAGGRVILNCWGLSDEAGVCPMFYFPDHPELTCDLPRHGSYEVAQFDAQLTTGDEYCDERGIDTVDFLKIDVEGAESRVMKGFAGRLAAQKIHCVQFEYGAFATQTRFLLGDFYSLLGQSYWIGKIFPGYVDFREYEWTIEDFRFSNYCCVSKARPDLRAMLAS
jgi:FkbM family methyltransferase